MYADQEMGPKTGSEAASPQRAASGVGNTCAHTDTHICTCTYANTHMHIHMHTGKTEKTARSREGERNTKEEWPKRQEEKQVT